MSSGVAASIRCLLIRSQTEGLSQLFFPQPGQPQLHSLLQCGPRLPLKGFLHVRHALHAGLQYGAHELFSPRFALQLRQCSPGACLLVVSTLSKRSLHSSLQKNGGRSWSLSRLPQLWHSSLLLDGGLTLKELFVLRDLELHVQG